MNDAVRAAEASTLSAKPATKPTRPYFSSSPCAKPPGWAAEKRATEDRKRPRSSSSHYWESRLLFMAFKNTATPQSSTVLSTRSPHSPRPISRLPTPHGPFWAAAAHAAPTHRVLSVRIEYIITDAVRATQASTLSAKPATSPTRPYLSSGPCAKPPGWAAEKLATDSLGRSHRSKQIGRAHV